MEKRMILAIVLMIAVIVITNIIFPPVTPPPEREGGDTVERVEDTAAAAGGEDTADALPREGSPEAPPETTPSAAESEIAQRMAERARRAEAGLPEDEAEGPGEEAQEEAAPDEGEIVTVQSPLYELRFSTRGAALVGAQLSRYLSYAPNGAGETPVQLLREGDRMLAYRIAAGDDTLDLSSRTFEASATELRVDSAGGPDSLTFRYDIATRDPSIQLAYRVTYHFDPALYAVRVTGAFEGYGRGYSVLTSLGHGLRSNEQDTDEDYGQLAYVVREQEGDIESANLDDVEPGETRFPEGGPFRWVALKNKYFLASLLTPPESSGFGGLRVSGTEAEHAAALEASLPVPAGSESFSLQAYFGPQEFDRLADLGRDLQNVNPYGYEWLSFIIRPLAGLITTILTWLHTAFGLAYGWVLILFGVMMRVVLFPLYQKSMRAQMGQMQIQPLIKDVKEKYEDDPQKMQKEMMRLYKEHDINPLAGCLPMLLPFPILITLFFVFQSTIEFRGVPFLYLPDLSLADPYYILPVVMGASMFLIQWIGQRGMERNMQMKLMGYGMPVIFTVVFLNFPAGLNLYYATSNLASLPQQYYLSKERQKMRSDG